MNAGRLYANYAHLLNVVGLPDEAIEAHNMASELLSNSLLQRTTVVTRQEIDWGTCRQPYVE